MQTFNFQTQSIRTRNGFGRLPQFVENTMKNNLLKVAKALRTGMRIKRWYLFSLFTYPLLKPHEGPGDFLARSSIANGRFIGIEGSDMKQSGSAHFLQHEVQTEIWLCLFIWTVFLSDSLLWVCKELGFGLEGVSIEGGWNINHMEEKQNFAKHYKPSQAILILSFDCAMGTSLTKCKRLQMYCD